MGFQQLYEEHVDFVWRVLRRQGVPDMSIEDAVQDVFVVAHRKLDEFEGRASVRTWLYTIARRIAFRYRRTESRAQRKHDALRQLHDDPVALEHRVVLRQAARILQAFLDELDASKREAFVLGVLEGFTRVELGEAMGVSPNTAYSRLRAAREAFEARFGASSRDPAAVLLDGARLAQTPLPTERDRVRAMVLAAIPKAAVTTTFALATKVAIGAIAFATTATIAIASTRPSPPAPDTAAAPSVHRDATMSEPDHTDSPARTHAAAADDPLAAANTGAPPGVAAAAPAGAASPRRGASPRSIPDPGMHSADGPSALARETALMERVRRALSDRDHARALALLAAHGRELSDGALAREAEASRIIALCGIGRAAQARGEAHRFVAAHPDHPLAAVVSRACPSITSPASGDQP